MQTLYDMKREVMTEPTRLREGDTYTSKGADIVITDGMTNSDILRYLVDEAGGSDTEIRSLLDLGLGRRKLSPLEPEIRGMCQQIAEFLVEKNHAYGNSAAEPVGIFAKRFDTLAQIDVRIDDKLNRLAKGSEYPGDDTIMDLIGYLVLRRIVAAKGEGDVR